MKRFFQTATLFGALFLGQQAFSQDIINMDIRWPAIPARDSKQELSQNSWKKNPFHIKRFSIEDFVQNVSYQDCRNNGLNYSLQNNQEPYNESRNFMMDEPMLKILYDISRDNKPFQLNSRITFTISSRPNFSQGNAFQGNQFYATRKNSPTSPIYGILRKFGKIRNIWKK